MAALPEAVRQCVSDIEVVPPADRRALFPSVQGSELATTNQESGFQRVRLEQTLNPKGWNARQPARPPARPPA